MLRSLEVAASLILLLPGSAAYSQDAQKSEPFQKRVDLVPVVFTVTDKHGHFVSDLQQNQFKILDNNLPPKQVLNFEAKTDLPLRVGLLIDVSNSSSDGFVPEKQAAAGFLRAIIRPATDRAFVLAFDEVPDTIQDFTNDSDKLAKGLQSLRPGGGTALWDAIYYACRDKMMSERNTTPVRRAMVIVANNSDDQSRVRLAEAIEMAMRAEVTVYAIGSIPNGWQNGGYRDLYQLVEQTGGRVFFPSQLSDLTQAFNQIQEELRSQYVIVFKPDNFQINGEFRTIQIIVGDPKLRVRARKGYYAPKQ